MAANEGMSIKKPETLTHGTTVFVSQQHKFGSDALLLANFCNAKRMETICDLGTGCGIIPLRLYDRGHRGICLAIDIASDAINLLEKSVAKNNANNITPICTDLRQFNHRNTDIPMPPQIEGNQFDVVTCNPPYFTGGFRSPDLAKATARHEEMCTTNDVCHIASTMLKDGGRLCMCQRPERLADVIFAMRTHKIEPKRLQFITAQPNKEPWLFLIEGQKNRCAGMRTMPLLVTENPDGTRPSPAMRLIYEE